MQTSFAGTIDSRVCKGYIEQGVRLLKRREPVLDEDSRLPFLVPGVT